MAARKLFYAFEISFIVLLAHENVCLDTKIRILCRIEAEILKYIIFMAAILENGCH